jgi:hypothetical protein
VDEQALQPLWIRARKILFVVSLSISLLAGTIFLAGTSNDSRHFMAGNVNGIYWFQIADTETFFLPGAIAIVSSLVVIITLSKIGWGERSLLVIVWLIIVVTVFTLLGPDIGSPTYTHTDSIRTRDAIYYAGDSAMWHGSCPVLRGDCTDAYLYTPVVFRCDPLGLLCRAIYHGDERLILARIEDLPTGTFARNGSTIRLLVDGEVVWEQAITQGND